MFTNKHSVGLCTVSTFKVTSRLSNDFNKYMNLVWKVINRDKYLYVHYKGCDKTYFSIVQIQYFSLVRMRLIHHD